VRKMVISLGLFGDSTKYSKGVKKFSKSAAKYLPDWQIVVFVGASVPLALQGTLIKSGVQVVQVLEKEDLSATAWRFRLDDVGDADWVIFRDADSIISRREAKAVTQWVESGLNAHIIRDHPFHSAPIMAGLWGIRPRAAVWFAREVKSHTFAPVYGSDQDFLASKVYPRIINGTLFHTSFHSHEQSKAQGTFEVGSSRLGEFCGESITSPPLERAYARLHRLISKRDCRCINSKL